MTARLTNTSNCFFEFCLEEVSLQEVNTGDTLAWSKIDAGQSQTLVFNRQISKQVSGSTTDVEYGGCRTVSYNDPTEIPEKIQVGMEEPVSMFFIEILDPILLQANMIFHFDFFKIEDATLSCKRLSERPPSANSRTEEEFSL